MSDTALDRTEERTGPEPVHPLTAATGVAALWRSALPTGAEEASARRRLQAKAGVIGLVFIISHVVLVLSHLTWPIWTVGAAGIVVAVIAMVIAAAAIGGATLAIVVAVIGALAIALVAASSIATTIGLVLPWLFARFGHDPALGSGPVATVIQDVMSLLIYFLVASVILV